jgi:hypothetical protein
LDGPPASIAFPLVVVIYVFIIVFLVVIDRHHPSRCQTPLCVAGGSAVPFGLRPRLEDCGIRLWRAAAVGIKHAVGLFSIEQVL